jgi:hypothetical protein
MSDAPSSPSARKSPLKAVPGPRLKAVRAFLLIKAQPRDKVLPILRRRKETPPPCFTAWVSSYPLFWLPRQSKPPGETGPTPSTAWHGAYGSGFRTICRPGLSRPVRSTDRRIFAPVPVLPPWPHDHRGGNTGAPKTAGNQGRLMSNSTLALAGRQRGWVHQRSSKSLSHPALKLLLPCQSHQLNRFQTAGYASSMHI